MTDRQSTHGLGCWDWGARHYGCAVREIERLRTENARLREAMSDTTDEIVRAAVQWWESNRPLSFTLDEHLEHCTVNTCCEPEKKLARAVANAVRISLDAKSSHRNDLVNVPEGERP